MRCLVVFLTVLFTSEVLSETLKPLSMPVDRTVGDGTNTWDLGRKVIYGDEDITVLNEVITDMEKSSGLKSKISLKEQLKPLDPMDVKCLMSVDKYCSKDMGVMKNIIIQALKDDCKSCTLDQKERAGQIVASMMAHDPVAWKLFLTRTALLIKPKTKRETKNIVEGPQLKTVGEPEEILSSKYRYTKPGFKVRVKRYAAERTL